MLNIIVVSDDLDPKIGGNCIKSHEHFENEVSLATENYSLIRGINCTSSQVEEKVASFLERNFILIGYSHGCDNALLTSIEDIGYVSQENCHLFGSGLIYTNSCFTGLKLKQLLIDAGCLGYVGYIDEVRLPYNEEDDILFIECENTGIINFLNSHDTLTESVKKMKDKYQEQYDYFLSQNMNASALHLLHNLGALTYYDTEDLTRIKLEV